MKKNIQFQELKEKYESACNGLIELFCQKQDIDFDGWVAEEVGSIASFCCQYFFNVSDIILDLETKQAKGLILQWQNEDVDFNLFRDQPQHINYKSYTMGFRHRDLKKTIL